MKKILFVAFAATLLAAGCQKTEIINPVGNAISFSTGMNKLTKAADADNEGIDNLKQQNFRIWAIADYEDANTTEIELDKPYDRMANLNVAHGTTEVVNGESKTTVDTWLPAKEYYWPGKDKALRFFAVSGVNLGEDLSTTDVVNIAINRSVNGTDQTVAPTMVINDFKVANTAPNADLMVADFVHQDQTTKEVSLNFRHALAKVEFLFKTIANADRNVYVQSLSVENVMTKSTLTVSENTDEQTKNAKPMTFDWDTATEAETFNDDYETVPTDFPAEVETIGTGTVDNTALKLTTTATNFTTWLVMPQTISQLQVKVRYVIGVREFESIFPLSTSDLEAWDANQYVRYTVTLAPNLISFVPNVQPWDQYDAVEDVDGNNTTTGNQDIEMVN